MKRKLVILSDHALTTSGVGLQTRYLIEGLLENKSNISYDILQLGAANFHTHNEDIKVTDNFKIKPIKGFGTSEEILATLNEVRPDAFILFSDARFFKHIFEVQDKIKEICPIMWWHVWDNRPYPKFNETIYNSVDQINCISYLTYNLLKDHYCDKIEYIPHTLPKNLFYQMDPEEIKKRKTQILGQSKKDHFVAIWANRNCRRKRPVDVLESWRIFLEKLDHKYKHQDAMLIMHTDPFDRNGPNLFETMKDLGLKGKVCFSDANVPTEEMNILYNISDCTLNISFAEGFGLSTLESMFTKTPIIVNQTGGLTRQVIDHRSCSAIGIALQPDVKSLNGNQETFYIYEDFVSNSKIADGIMEMYELGSGREVLGEKAFNYVAEEFDYNIMINSWINSIEKCIKNRS